MHFCVCPLHVQWLYAQCLIAQHCTPAGAHPDHCRHRCTILRSELSDLLGAWAIYITAVELSGMSSMKTKNLQTVRVMY